MIKLSESQADMIRIAADEAREDGKASGEVEAYTLADRFDAIANAGEATVDEIDEVRQYVSFDDEDEVALQVARDEARAEARAAKVAAGDW